MNLLQVCFIRAEVKKRELVLRLDLAIKMLKRKVPVIICECSYPQVLKKLVIFNYQLKTNYMYFRLFFIKSKKT